MTDTPAEAPVDLEGLDRRIASQTEWLRENSPYCFHDQKHLDEGSPERAYWHYGYLVALKDVWRQFEALLAENAKLKDAKLGLAEALRALCDAIDSPDDADWIWRVQRARDAAIGLLRLISREGVTDNAD
jgi:hypothetical protein